MKLTSYTDYSLRVLIFLALQDQSKLIKIHEIANTYSISKNHLAKVVHQLGKAGYLLNTRGRNGGLKLAKAPLEINIGTVVRETEDDFYMVECFDPARNTCVITPACSLKHILADATNAYLDVLDRYTLHDVVQNPAPLLELLEQSRV
ncbi:RrF2 family transcriptional regulator [Shouchella xiaoxiensis]|nr:Rrf2 family transcriptional regulator [Shouchella xiaoxiensis]